LRYCFDIESNGLLKETTEIHCIVLKDIDTGEVHTKPVLDAIDLLEKAELIVGHNIIKFDIPVLRKLHGFVTKAAVFDTLIATRLVYPDIAGQDFATQNFPRDCIGRHSLRAWGYRIGNYKGDYDGGFTHFTKEMLDYCVQDVEVTYALWLRIQQKGYSEQAMQLEHEVVTAIHEQEQHGFTFNTKKAEELYTLLNTRLYEIKEELQQVFPPKLERTPFTPKVNNKSRGYVKGVRTYKEKIIEFNPASRQHIAERLAELHNWEPSEYTADGKPKMDDAVLSNLPYPEAKPLAEHFLLEKRIGQLATGKQAWMKCETNGKIHGTCNTNSTVTARASHANPNLAQIPSVSVPYGKECRSLFTVPKGHKLVGIDVSGLEVRMLAHYMARYDDGKYADVVLNGDIHTETQRLAGLDSRDLAKRFYYCFLYGGGVKKIAQVTGKTVHEASKVKKRFLNNLPALNTLITNVQQAAARGYLIGLDKRNVKVRSPHAALNTLLQSGGAIVCKQWLVEFNKAAVEYDDVRQVVWVHDEIQVECPKELATDIGELAVDAIKRTGEHFNLRLPLTGEYKVGDNWSETH
jgi:DNA polymerase I-like protein with 3'-5' exonuclease and polymerase domains